MLGILAIGLTWGMLLKTKYTCVPTMYLHLVNDVGSNSLSFAGSHLSLQIQSEFSWISLQNEGNVCWIMFISSYSKSISSTHHFHITFGVIIMILGERNLATWMRLGQWTQFLNFAMFHAHYCYHKPIFFGILTIRICVKHVSIILDQIMYYLRHLTCICV
jgi:hypothetical protein